MYLTLILVHIKRNTFIKHILYTSDVYKCQSV